MLYYFRATLYQRNNAGQVLPAYGKHCSLHRSDPISLVVGRRRAQQVVNQRATKSVVAAAALTNAVSSWTKEPVGCCISKPLFGCALQKGSDKVIVVERRVHGACRCVMEIEVKETRHPRADGTIAIVPSVYLLSREEASFLLDFCAPATREICLRL